MFVPKPWVKEALKICTSALIPGGLVLYVAWKLFRQLWPLTPWGRRNAARFAARTA